MPALAAKAGVDADEACPVCKQSRYLNPKMTFKISPQCYHRMCDSCIDRIYGPGPAPCPVAGCGRTLRRNEFRKQTFEDLGIERECDLRRYVAGILNKREADFDTLRDFNDYLQKKEDITWNLIYNIDVKATRADLAEYARRDKADIERNNRLEQAERELIEANEDERRRRAAEAQEDLRRELAEERSAREAQSKRIAGALMAATGDVDEAVRKARGDGAGGSGGTVRLKKSSAARNYKTDAQRRQDALQDLVASRNAKGAGAGVGVGAGARSAPSSAAAGASGLSFAGLRKAEPKKASVGPYDPFGGLRLDTDYYKLRDGGNYEHSMLDKFRDDPAVAPGGYDVRDYYSRAVFEAHAGLGVILAKEKAGQVA